MRELTIGVIYIQNALGECAIGFECLYALKHIYPCKLVVFANSTMQKLLRYCSFVDKVESCDREAINAWACDYAILTNAKTYHIRFALSTNAKTIICATKFASLFSWRCKSVPIYMGKKYYHYDEREILLAYARAINPKHYDEKFPTLDLRQSKIICHSSHYERADAFFAHTFSEVKQDRESHATTFLPPPLRENEKPSKNRLQKTAPQEIATRGRYVIMINPFNNACAYSLSLQGYLRLASAVASRGDCVPFIVIFDEVASRFSQALDEYMKVDSTLSSSLLVYHNSDDLLQLCAFISRVSVVISPSTGTLHLALNQRIPTIAIYPRFDTRRWATHNKRYVFVESPLDTITQAEEDIIIQGVMHELDEMIQTQEICTRDTPLLEDKE